MATHPLLNPWQRLFLKHGFTVNLERVVMPERKGKENLPIVWPTEISDDDIVTMFVSAVSRQLQFAAFVPNKLSDRFKHARDSKNGSYAFWVTSPVYEDDGKLCSTRASIGDHLSVPELYLYHLWMIEGHGEAYASVVGSGCGYCAGTTYIKALDKSPGIEWDPQDIKVSFRHTFRAAEDVVIVHPD